MNNDTKEEKNKMKSFFEKHKKEICVTGCTIFTLCCATFLFKHKWSTLLLEKDTIIPIAEKTVTPITFSAETVVENVSSVKVIDVREHIRNLPQGHYPSIKKIEEAAKQGIQLTDNQTIVSAHSRCYAA